MPSLTPNSWARVRYEYERTARPVEDICAAHGISSGTLRDRMRRWGWTRRRPPVPAEGPEALTIPLLNAPRIALQPIETSSTRSPDGAQRNPGPASPQKPPHSALLHAGYTVSGASHEANPPPASDAAANIVNILPGLQHAAARLLPAIEAIAARLAAGPQHPREIEQTARALGTLMRTLREMNALLDAQRDAAPESDDDPALEDIDEFRLELARRIDAFVAEHDGKADGDDDAGEA